MKKPIVFIVFLAAICGCMSTEEKVQTTTTFETTTLMTTSSIVATTSVVPTTSTILQVSTTTTIPSVQISLTENRTNLTIFTDTQGFNIKITNENNYTLYNLTVSAVTSSGSELKTSPSSLVLRPGGSQEVFVEILRWLFKPEDAITIKTNIQGCGDEVTLDVIKNGSRESGTVPKKCSCSGS